MTAPRDVDVIVPVHGAGAAFGRLAASLARHGRPGERVIVIMDGPADEPSRAAVDVLRRSTADVLVLEHPVARGFVASVNRGMAESSRDVVLLNSDTRVTARWTEKLAEAVYSAPDIATATPFANHGTLCSLPRPFVENALPAGFDEDALAAIVERVAAPAYPSLPTGVGAFLYIRRQVLADLGLFDEAAFGEGYGEEVDFCLRASRAGWRHVLDDRTFIFHEGGRSFGRRRAARVRQAHRVIARREPGYLAAVGAFMKTDPLRQVRDRVLAALAPAAPRPARTPAGTDARPVVHLVHGWPPWAQGGTELYAAWLAALQAETRPVAVYARIADPDRVHGEPIEYLDRGVRVRLVANNFVERNPLTKHALRSRVLDADFRSFLAETQPAIVHVHHLSGHAASLMAVAARSGARIVYQSQDWWPACARINFWHRDGYVCDGPTPRRCSQCLPMTERPGAAVLNPALHALRARLTRAALAHADVYVMGSRFMADTGRSLGFFAPGRPVHVLPYAVPNAGAPANSASARPLLPPRPVQFGYLGAWMPHKGLDVAIQAFAGIAPDDALLHVWGSSGDAAYGARILDLASRTPAARLHGVLPEYDKLDRLRGLDVLLVPSVGWESFGIVAREAMAEGVPVIASDQSALTELFADGRGGRHVPPGDVAALAAVVREVIGAPETLASWRPDPAGVTSLESHAAAIDEIYGALLALSRGKPA